MSKIEPEENFEKRLREFRPAQPPPLVIPRQTAAHGWAIAAVAAILVAIGIGILRHSPPPMSQPAVSRPVTLGQFNAALRQSDHDLDRIFDQESPRLLTQQHQGSALYELSKE